ncbi:MAG: hypothetical protein DCF15_12590 [Phormidesmis priestleyi]|uniref:Protein kinase domain-containing protein n=1 Tax=Phormidesmis priestleyi TaxID=268141 RepID=A0A2W4Z5Y8_9CYAN|nr:MAG: hypothetical protein DCF15_12590 [Phormidesmis priestleyi]
MATFSPHAAVSERLRDRYEILHSIGQPFGYQQLLAHDIQQQRRVVVKSLTIKENTPNGDIGCFEREISLLKSLNHPTIPRYIDSFSLDTTFDTAKADADQRSATPNSKERAKERVLVQAHGSGKILAGSDNAGQRYGESEIRAIAKQLLQGLVYLHSKGLVHRDIKPSNIIISAQPGELGQLSWLNLSSVQYVQAQRSDAMVGTYGFMPPEQVGGQATFASDLYSLGATLIYLVTGHPLGKLPRNGLKNGPKVYFACSTMQLSANFQAWLNWLIEPYVGDRPASAKQALSALNHLPFAMLKRRLLAPSRMQILPIPIKSLGQDADQPFFTQIRSAQKARSLELAIPPAGLKSARFRQALPPLTMGGVMLGTAFYLFSLLHFSLDTITSFSGIASLAAASLGFLGCSYSFRFLRSGCYVLTQALLRTIHVQLEADVLLVSYRYWLRSPTYIINTRRADIYNISALPDGGALRILTHQNRTQAPCDCYKLAVTDGALSHRDIRWLTSLLNEWRLNEWRQPHH